MGESLIQRAFAAGELAPVLHSRADQVKYTTGLRTCRNLLVRREGGAQNRAGFRFVAGCKTDDFGTRLMRYVGSTPGGSFLIEMGASYFRFYQDGAVLEVTSADAYSGATTYSPGDIVDSGGTYYYCTTETVGVAPPNASFWYELPGGVLEIPTSYTLSDLPDWNQSGNVITLTHQDHPPRELIYGGGNHWVLQDVSTAPTIAVPQNVAGTAAAAGARTFKYKVTAAKVGTYEESNASAVATVASTTAPTEDAPIPLTWDADADAEEWYVYCDPYENGIYGYVGTAATNAFQHAGQTPDFNLTPPVIRTLFDAAGEYPARCANYQQRRFFANSADEPDAIWGSRIGLPANFGISSPLQDDDAVNFRLAGNNHHPIEHMAALKAGLVLLTSGGEWTVTGGDGPRTPITPSSISADQETYVGVARDVRPVVVGNSILYVQARGTVMRELKFDQDVEGLAGRDLTIFATHLFERKTLVAVDYQQVPHSIIWCVRSDGALLGLTYIPDQDIWGWHRHDTTVGAFEDVCVVPETDEDVLYAIVQRTIGGATKRYVERLERRELLEGFIHSTSFFVDSGLSYSGAPASTFAGLDHLNGQRVAVYADGEVIADGVNSGPFVVAGTVSIGVSATNVHIGLPITSEFETLDVDVQGAAIRDKQKRVHSVGLIIESSSRLFQAGRDEDHLRWYIEQPWQTATDTASELLELNIPSAYDKPGRILVRQAYPLPLTILGVIPHVELGGQ